MVTAALALSRSLIEATPQHWFTVFCASRPDHLAGLDYEAVLCPHRNEVAVKLAWMPFVEAAASLDAILYPYWPSPPFRRAGAPPAVICIYDLAYRVRPDEVPWQQRAYMGTLVPRALASAAAVVTPSAATKRDLLEHYPLAGLAERTHVVGLGTTPLNGARGSLPEGLEPGYILAVGTVEPRKNYPRLVEAYRRLRAGSDSLPPLVVAGRVGWAYGDAVDLLRSTPGVRYLEHVDDETLSILFRKAGLLACPSLYEGFGFSVVDAMALGLPVLAGRAGSLPEVAGGAVLEVDPEDTEAIASGLDRLLTDAPLRRDLGRRGRARAAHFNWSSAGTALAGLLEEAAVHGR
jgi:glycosyltransferase involved in cell wall biosynthesis